MAARGICDILIADIAYNQKNINRFSNFFVALLALLVVVHTVSGMSFCAKRRGVLMLVRRKVVMVSRSEKSAMKAKISLIFWCERLG